MSDTPAVTRYRFDPAQAVFNVATRPGLAGLGVKVVGVTGSIEMTLDASGTLDLRRPVVGAFEVTLDNIATANQLVSAAGRQFFGGDDTAIVRGDISGAESDGVDRYRIAMTLHARDRDVAVGGSARLVSRPTAALEATGDTMCDPRAFGLPLPPLVNLMIHTRWRVALLTDEEREGAGR